MCEALSGQRHRRSGGPAVGRGGSVRGSRVLLAGRS